MKIKYTSEIMKYISMFESLSGAKVKDCIAKDCITMIVQQNEMGKAIGKGGQNIKRLSGILRKDIKLFEFNSSITSFVENLLKPVRVDSVIEENGIVTINCQDKKTRGLVMGRDRHNLEWISSIVKRHFDVQEIKVEMVRPR